MVAQVYHSMAITTTQVLGIIALIILVLAVVGVGAYFYRKHMAPVPAGVMAVKETGPSDQSDLGIN